MKSTLAPVSMRKQEWPNQVIFMRVGSVDLCAVWLCSEYKRAAGANQRVFMVRHDTNEASALATGSYQERH